MSRPRWGSPTLVAVAGAACIVGGIIAAVAGGSLERTQDIGRHALFAYRNALYGAIGIFGVAAICLLIAGVLTMARYRERVLPPFGGVIGFMLATLGIMARASHDPGTARIASAVLLTGFALTAVSFGYCYWMQRTRGGGAFVVAGLLVAAGAATMTVAEYALEPITGLSLMYRSNAVLLPALGLLVAGLSTTVYVALGYMFRRQPARAITVVSATLLAASAIYPVAAVRLMKVRELTRFEPPGLAYANHIQLAGLALMIGSALLMGYTILGGRRSARILAAQLSLSVLVTGAVLVGLARFVLSSPDMPMLLPADQGADQQMLLYAAVAVALAELTVVLAVTRYFFSFFTSVSIAGVAIGAMALVIVLSVMSGFENDLRNKILGSNAHVLITKNDGSFTEYREIQALIEDVPGVIATTPYLETEVVIAANKNYSNVVVKGVDPSTVGAVTELDENARSEGALERLWPLADDGGVLGQPRDAGVSDTPVSSWDGGVPDANTVDPPPADLKVDFGEPVDFSSDDDVDDTGADDSGTEPDGEPKGEPKGEMDDGEAGDMDDDAPPDDMDVDFGDPTDFNGGESGPDADTGADTGFDTDTDMEADTGLIMDLGDSSLITRADPLFEPPLLRDDDAGFADFETSAPPRIPPHIAVLPGVLVGKELVKQIHLYVGQEVRIISPLSEDTPAGPVPRTRSLRVADEFYSGMYEYDFMFVYVALDVLQAFLDREGEVTGIEVRIADPDNTGPLLGTMRERLPDGYRVQDWQEINRSLFAALKLEKIAMFLVLAIIILVASFSIIGNLIMVVVEKAREIALIKTLGASSFGIMRIFISQGFFIGIVGTIVGVVHGLIACSLGATFGLPLNPEVYYIDRLPIHVEEGAIAAVAIAGMMISVIATLYPAYVGARLRPIEGLRYE